MSFGGEQRGYYAQYAQQDARQEARTHLVHEHLRFKPDAERQDLFALDEGALDELKPQVPQVKDQAMLKQIDVGAVVYQEGEGLAKSFGVVCEVSRGSYQPPEKMVRPLYEKVKTRGHFERRWYKWVKNPTAGGRINIDEVKALTSKKEARGGAVVDVAAYWKRFREDDRLVEERQDFNGERHSRVVTVSKEGRVLRVEARTVTKAGSTQQVDDFTRKPFPVKQIVIDGKALPEQDLSDLDMKEHAVLQFAQRIVDPSDIDFRYGSYYQDEN